MKQSLGAYGSYDMLRVVVVLLYRVTLAPYLFTKHSNSLVSTKALISWNYVSRLLRLIFVIFYPEILSNRDVLLRGKP